MTAPWLVLLLVSAPHGGYLAAHETSTSKSEKLVELLRRQLMADNYDYMSDNDDSGPATTTTTGTREERQEKLNAADERSLRLLDDTRELVGNDSETNYLETSHGKQPDEDDERRPPPGDSSRGPRAEDGAGTTHVHTGTKFKYKMLKITRRELRRRAGEPARRSFLQEQGARGVALIRLDDGPFPLFRLPKTRRQYMVSDDEDDGAALGDRLLDTKHYLQTISD